MNKQEEYVTATQAWQMMGVSNAKLARMIAAGEVPWKSDPRHKQKKLIPMSYIQQFLEAAGPPIKKERHEDQNEEALKDRPAAQQEPGGGDVVAGTDQIAA